MPERPPPLIALLGMNTQRMSRRVLEAQHEYGFTDIRPAHGAVFAQVPPEGIRLTDLAKRAEMTKQAMSELVNDLERLGYLVRSPDPADGRSRIIEFSERGWEAINHALDVFDAMEAELAEALGERKIADLRRTLQQMVALPDA